MTTQQDAAQQENAAMQGKAAMQNRARQKQDEAAREDEAERLRQAALRWQRRADERHQKLEALDERDYVKADSPERLARWVDRHRRWLRVLDGQERADGRADVQSDRVRLEGRGGEATSRLRADSPVLGVQRQRSVRREDISNELVERVIGETRDMLSIEFFELGLLAARCVGLVVTRGQPNGTGFLVAPGLMLTNEHVLRTVGEAAHSELELDFEDNRVGEPKQTQIFPLEPDRFFLANAALDFALVGVSTTSHRGTKLDDYRVLPLIGEEGKVRIGEAVNVVQHPSGRVKQVALRNNRLVDLPEGEDMSPFFHYEADTEKGSSGSPVFNDFWEVVALHHSGVPATDDEGRLVDAHGRLLDAGSTSDYVWVANEGIRVSRIVAAVRAADLPPHMQATRDDALRTWQWRGDPEVAAVGPLSPVAGSPLTGTSDAGFVGSQHGQPPQPIGTSPSASPEPATTIESRWDVGGASRSSAGATRTVDLTTTGVTGVVETKRGQVIDVTLPIRVRISLDDLTVA
jgi:hypothetical protein